MNTPIFVFCTVPDREIAATIGKKLVDARLAACVSVGSANESIYRWQGNVEEATEYLMTIKSMKENYPAIENLIVSLHPYDTPEIVSVRMDTGLKSYLDWIELETS